VDPRWPLEDRARAPEEIVDERSLFDAQIGVRSPERTFFDLVPFAAAVAVAHTSNEGV
jgi:hypothetical protein